MKKAFLFILTCSIVSLSFAGLDLQTISGLSYEVSGNTVTISSTLPVTGFIFNLTANDASELSNGFVYPGGIILPWPESGHWDPVARQWLGAAFSVGTAQDVTGLLFSINFAPTAQTINFVYSSMIGEPTIAVHGQVIDLTGYSMTVPEPFTLLLLGSGALFMARGKN